MRNDREMKGRDLALPIAALSMRLDSQTTDLASFAVPAGMVSPPVGPNIGDETTPGRTGRSVGPMTGGGFRLRGRAHKVALTVHILTSVGWFGIAVVIAFCVLVAGNTSDRALANALYRTMEIAPWLSIPVGVAAVASGAVLGLGTTFGLIRHWWVVAKIVIATAVVVTDAILFRTLARSAVVTGNAPRPLSGVSIAHVVVLAIAVVVSVFKPRGLTPWGRGRRVATSPLGSERGAGGDG
jgi:hypothetical protein